MTGRKEWNRYIDMVCLDWGMHPEQIDEPPSAKAMLMAVHWMLYCRDRRVSPPDEVSPDGFCGIVANNRMANGIVESMTFFADGTCELKRCRGSRVLSRLTVVK